MPGKCASNENENHSHLDVSFLSKLNGITRLYLPLAFIEACNTQNCNLSSFLLAAYDMKKEIIFMCGFDTLIIGRRSETLQVATVICLKSIIMACSFYGGHCFFRYLSIIPSGVVKNWCFPSKKSQKLYCFIKGGKLHFKFSRQKLTCICSFQRQNSNMKKPTKNYETFSGKYPTVFWPKKKKSCTKFCFSLQKFKKKLHGYFYHRFLRAPLPLLRAT